MFSEWFYNKKKSFIVNLHWIVICLDYNSLNVLFGVQLFKFKIGEPHKNVLF